MTVIAERYRLIDRIGAGGLGVVYRAFDQSTGDTVALKVMPRSPGATNLRSEFVALARLRHPNIVSVLDYGLTERGDDFFTMELVDGPPLAAAAAVGSEVFYQLVGGVLRALAYVHARDMIHADIKPSNILVDASRLDSAPVDAARLADFGLATHAGDPAMAAARGTFPFAAPEVYAGHLDARSDIYALGISLYQVVTGELPYRGRTIRELLATQRRTAPADPRALNPQLDPQLAELIVAMCDPLAGARPQTADEVLGRINEIAGTNFDIANSTPLVDFGHGIVGRERDFGELQRLWREAKDGRGGAALLVGDDGVGKSRLLAEIRLFIQLDGGRVLYQSLAHQRAQPISAIGAICREALATEGIADGESRHLLAGLLGGGSLPQATSELAEASSRFALAEAVTDAVCAAGEQRPLAILVDDLELADPTSANVLSYLARAASSAPILLICAGEQLPWARTEGGPTSAVALLADALTNAERGSRIALPALDAASLHRLVEEALGRQLAGKLTEELHRASGGNPAHAIGALELMVADGAIRRERGMWVLEHDAPVIPVPPSAQAAAVDRVMGLSTETRAVIDQAAILGETFRHADLVALCGDDRATVDLALADAALARVLLSDPSAGTYHFGHPAMVAALRECRSATERRAAHLEAAALLDGRLDDGEFVPPGLVAAQYLLAEANERGIALALQAAESCLASYDHHGALHWFRRIRPLAEAAGGTAATIDERIGDLESLIGDADEAILHYRRAHEQAEPGPTRIRLARRIGELLRRRGRGDEALEVLMQALDEARQKRLFVEQASCHLRIGWVLMYRAEYKAAMEHAIAGLFLAKGQGEVATAAELGRLRGAVEIYQGESSMALDHLADALTEAESSGDDLLTAGILHEMGRAAIHAGHYDRAIDVLERAILTTERRGYIEQTARSLNNLGAACYFQGNWPRARDAWDRFRRLCERLDEQSELVNALNNLGSLYRDLGQLVEATTTLDRAAHVAQQTGHTHMAAMIAANQGEVMYRKGDLAGAREQYGRAAIEFERIGAREDLIETRRRVCEVDIASGRLTESIDRAVDTARAARDAGAKLEEAILHRVAATALRLNGDFESSQWFIDKARELLAALGSRHELARVDLEAAELALVLGDTQKAEALFRAAIAVFGELGARWDLGIARSRERALPEKGGARASTGSRAGFDLLLELSRAAASFDVEKLLEVAMDRILEVTRYERGFVLLLDRNGRPREKLRRSRPGAPAFARDDAEFSGTIVRRVAATGEAVSVSNIDDEIDFRDQRSVVALGLRQIMCAPLKTRGRVLGVIYIDSRRLSFEDHGVDLKLLEALAAQVAIATENAHLSAEEARRSELMSVLAHEIRNPLSAILGYSDIGQSGESESIGMNGPTLFGRIHHDAQRLRRLVDNVLEVARHESGNVEWAFAPFDVAELIADAVTSHLPACEQKQLELVTDTAALTALAHGSADRIMQVIANLLTNAIKFTPAGGRIVITARTEAVDADDPAAPPIPATESRAWLPNDGGGAVGEFIRIDVADNGPGMSRELTAQLFEKFAQGRGEKRAAGVGLGLYISKGIVERHGGSIWCESAPGKGSTFSIRIPAAKL